MPGDENYQRHPGEKLSRGLHVYGWELVGDNLWEKWGSRLYVDSVGVFLYRVTWVTPKSGVWRRTHGLSHNLIPHKARRITFKDLSVLDLTTGLLEHK